MTWRERLAAAWDYPRLREKLAETRKDLADSQVKCAQLEDNLLRLVAKCDELSDTAQRCGDTLARTRQSMKAFRAALLSFCPELNTVERLRQFYDCVTCTSRLRRSPASATCTDVSHTRTPAAVLRRRTAMRSCAISPPPILGRYPGRSCLGPPMNGPFYRRWTHPQRSIRRLNGSSMPRP